MTAELDEDFQREKRKKGPIVDVALDYAAAAAGYVGAAAAADRVESIAAADSTAASHASLPSAAAEKLDTDRLRADVVAEPLPAAADAGTETEEGAACGCTMVAAAAGQER